MLRGSTIRSQTVRALDWVATGAARGLLAWGASRVDLSRRGWIAEMRRELDQIDGGWARLVWAVDGLRLVWLTDRESRHRVQADWPEPWSALVGAVLLGFLSWMTFATSATALERTPAELVFGFLALYCYSVGFLSGRRTGKTGTGAWAGATSGLAFAMVVYLAVLSAAASHGMRDSVISGTADLVAIACTGLVFFVLMGAGCGALGARSATHNVRQRRW